MTVVVSLTGITPPARYDDVPWTEAQIEESADGETGWTTIETIVLDPADDTPAEPATRNFTTTLGTAPALFYRVTFLDADGFESPTTPAVQNTSETVAYAQVEELARLLSIRTPTTEQEAAMQRILDTAAGEINSEIGRTSLAGWELSLAEEVNLERAVEHWQQAQTPFGLFGLGSDSGAVVIGADSWKRHADKLAPLKAEWGIA